MNYLVTCFHIFDVVQHILFERVGRSIDVEEYFDSKSVFDVLEKWGRTVEIRLQIDIRGLRESYAVGKLAKLGCLQGQLIKVDGMRKQL